MLVSRSFVTMFDTVIFTLVLYRIAAGRWFSLGTPVSSTNKTDHLSYNFFVQIFRFGYKYFPQIFSKLPVLQLRFGLLVLCIILNNISVIYSAWFKASLAWCSSMLHSQWKCICCCPICEFIASFHLKSTSIIIMKKQ
jgi:hypothetical protein